jgi:hypothetical protein
LPFFLHPFLFPPQLQFTRLSSRNIHLLALNTRGALDTRPYGSPFTQLPRPDQNTHSPALDTCPYGGHFTQLPLLDRRTHTRLRGNTCPYGGHFTRLSLSLPDYRDAYTRPRRNRNARAVRGSRLVFLPLLAFSSKRTARVACLPSRQEGTTSHKHSL